jgi:hypothetical protein
MAVLSLDEHKLLGQLLRDELSTLNYGQKTERSYVVRIKRFLTYQGWQEPASLTESTVNAFLTLLAVDGYLAVSTQTQALSAI